MNLLNTFQVTDTCKTLSRFMFAYRPAVLLRAIFSDINIQLHRAVVGAVYIAENF